MDLTQEMKLSRKIKATCNNMIKMASKPQLVSCLKKDLSGFVKQNPDPNILMNCRYFPRNTYLFEVLLDNGMDEEVKMILSDKRWNPQYFSRFAQSSTPFKDCLKKYRFDFLEKMVSHPKFNPNFTHADGESLFHFVLTKASGKYELDLCHLLDKLVSHPKFDHRLHQRDLKIYKEKKATKQLVRAYQKFIRSEQDVEKKICCGLIQSAVQSGANPNCTLAEKPVVTAFEFFWDNHMEQGIQTVVANKEWNPNYSSRQRNASSPINDCLKNNRYDILVNIMLHPKFNPFFEYKKGKSVSDLIRSKLKGPERKQILQRLNQIEKNSSQRLWNLRYCEGR